MRPTISLYTGIGGLDLGLEAAGFGVAVAVESDRDATDVIQINRSWPIVCKPIEAVATKELLQTAGITVGDAALLTGGPPCQPFSKAGYWVSGDVRRLDDPRASTIEHYMRVLRDSLPEAYLLENVPGLIYAGKNEGLVYMRRQLDAINEMRKTRYTMVVRKLNAASFGVPQLRERVFVIGHRDGKEFRFPETPTHFPPDDPRRVGEPYLNAWDAIGELEEDDDPALRVRGKWADLLPSIPEGKNYLWHTSRGGGRALFGWRTRYWSFLLKLSKTRPAWTLQAQPGPAVGPFHWKCRRLSARELCRLQTIPDSYKVPSSIRTVTRLLGNAVPSALAELLGKEIRQQFFGDVLAGVYRSRFLGHARGISR
jgi:DNA (cytosine-5)-methyltransferase 1